VAKAINIDKHARRVMSVADAQLKAKSMDESGDPGWVEGYAAVWDNVDRQNEVMIKGCFARSIAQSVPAGKVKLMSKHFRDGGDSVECIGTVTQAKEDDIGLWVHADFSSTEDAQKIRVKILEKHIKGLSVGYWPVRWEVRNQTQNAETIQTVAHLETHLGEVTTTVKPVNELAGITAAKSINEATPPKNGGEGKDPAPQNAAQNTGKPSEPAPGGPPATPPAGKTEPLDLPRIKRDLALKRARLGLLAG
jgi:HK97 family phage prohead protease